MGCWFSSAAVEEAVKPRVLFIGCPGSGKTSLAKSVADVLSVKMFDTDEYLWADEEHGNYTDMEPDRFSTIIRDLVAADTFTIAGNIAHQKYWNSGREILSAVPFTGVVFIQLDTEENLKRVAARQERLQSEVESYKKLVDTIQTYQNSSDVTKNTLARHEEWLKTLGLPVCRIDGVASIEENTSVVHKWIASIHSK